jgi:hypothetical protein
MRGAEWSKSLVSSFSYPTEAMEEMNADAVIKKIGGCRAEVYWAGM